MDDRLGVLHIVDMYLPVTENWIYSQIVGVKQCRCAVAARALETPEAFPFPHVHQCPRLIARPKSLLARGVNRVVESALGIQRRRQVAVAREFGADLLHAHFGPIGYQSLALKKATGLPLITAFYGMDACALPNQSPKWRDRYRTLFEQGDLFLAEGSHMRETLISLGCPREKAVVQHLGVNLDLIPFEPRRPAEDGTITVIMVGSFREKKGLPYGVRAFAKVTHERPNLRLVIVGDGRTPRELEIKREILGCIEDGGIEDRVRITGYIPHEEFLREVRQAHICLQPSVTAADGDAEGGAPVCLIEMSASGMPVVASRHCDIPEVIVDGASGFLVPERDVDALAERLLYLADRRETWEDMARAGRTHVEEEYDAALQVQRLEGVYRSLLTVHRSPPSFSERRE